MNETFEQRLKAIRWNEFRTAYGPAIEVPEQLRHLAGTDRQAALSATHDLWSGLCHQHVQVGSAAVPALPFLLEVFDRGDRDINVELLDILLGFAIGVNRRRAAEFQRESGRGEIPEAAWVSALRHALLAELPRFVDLASSVDDEIADFAGQILVELNDRETAD